MTIYDPRRPEIMLWLAAMEPCEAACVMTAMRDTFPILRGNREWADHLSEMCAGMSDKERREIGKRAARIGRRNVDELADELGYRPYLR